MPDRVYFPESWDWIKCARWARERGLPFSSNYGFIQGMNYNYIWIHVPSGGRWG